MTEYTLYYWPIPFRGQFVRSVLAHVGASWTEANVDDLIALKDAETTSQLVPHMGPPELTDHTTDLSLAQTPAILSYLGDKHGNELVLPSFCSSSAVYVPTHKPTLLRSTSSLGRELHVDRVVVAGSRVELGTRDIDQAHLRPLWTPVLAE